MSGLRKNKVHSFESLYDYSHFEKLNGSHPWMEQVPEGYVPYRVRELNYGKIVYFNFILAKEMGLIPEDHPHKMNTELAARLRETFSIQIINEYDELNKRRIDPKTIKPNKFMATRYLQLQHDNKKGKTSGDGRGIWNGTLTYKGSTWDVSSRGTGVTCLAPGAVQANKPLKTGGTQYGYGCGLAEIDELLSCSISAEIMHLQGYETERVLCVIDHENNHGIGVRASKNLFRPAHLFLYLKQNRYQELKKAVDFIIDRQIKNGKWNISIQSQNKYLEMSKIVTEQFAKFAANLETDYVFAWLDWDGDNVLVDAGIIDYGSIRQFGICHDNYRYDDVQRFSTNLKEQKNKALLIAKIFAQAAEFLTTGIKPNLSVFKKHDINSNFENIFQSQKTERFLYRLGLNQSQRVLLMQNHSVEIDEFKKIFNYFECAKVSGKIQKVPDGINRPPLFNMRKALKELPKQYNFKSGTFEYIPENRFFKLILSSFSKKNDTVIRVKHAKKIRELQKSYFKLLGLATGSGSKAKTQMLDLQRRSDLLNSKNRITGNALVEIVGYILEEKNKKLTDQDFQKVIDKLIQEHSCFPEVKKSKFYKNFNEGSYISHEIYRSIQQLRLAHAEDI